MLQLPCTISHCRSQKKIALELVTPDFNCQRWLLSAVRSHPALRLSLVASAVRGSSLLIDGTLLLDTKEEPTPGTHVALMDGFSTLEQLQDKHPTWNYDQSLIPVYVGVFQELLQGFPSHSLPLFNQTQNTTSYFRDTRHVQAPLAQGRKQWGRSRLRRWRNRMIAPEKHRMLKRGGQVVFCGTVRPPEYFFSHLKLSRLLGMHSDTLRLLANTQWHGEPLLVRQAVPVVLNILQQKFLDPSNNAKPFDWVLAYSFLNLLQRMAVLSLLSVRTVDLLVNEFGLDRHFDPYNVVGYKQNVFLDFGSLRGPDTIYPRTVDMMMHGKMPLFLRFLQPDQALADALTKFSPDNFWVKCESQVEQALLIQSQIGK